MALCGLGLREYRREAVLVHWVDPKSLLRFLLHCHSYCSYCQRGIERGMWQSRCNLPCTSWPSAGGLAPIFWRTVGVCFVLHTGRVMSGVCEFSSVTRLWVSLSLSPEIGGACALCWSMLKWPPSWGEVTQPQGCRQWIFTVVGCSGATPTHLWLCGCTWHLYQLLTVSLVTIQIKSMLNSDQLTNQETTIM